MLTFALFPVQYEELERAVSEVHARHKAEDADERSKMHKEQLESRNRLQLLGEYEVTTPCAHATSTASTS